jgi:hypothetical protein
MFGASEGGTETRMLSVHKLTVFGVLRISVPVVRAAIVEFAKARALSSEAGRKITPLEWETLTMEIGLRVGETLLDKIKSSEHVIDV